MVRLELLNLSASSDRFTSSDGAERVLLQWPVVTSQKEISELIEAGFEFILQKDGLAYFGKRR